ncbi:hypothetical protein Tdes44962_MAKER06267 [Teratosphaeria destructans]|uniref:Uncharacterized protein n=1 Tax=Teratosphaeria destructans TaxID=418781 RepID=A0A9W7SHU0_9PEZI|nr:hypothetical protein Tdes44962_MAKER06267 [Teratosphaeria destructans]
MADMAPVSDESGDALTDLRPAALNFSRPRPMSVNSKAKIFHDSAGTARGNTRVISAFHEPNRELPAEPRFSLESDQTDSSRSINSNASDLAWDGRLGELISKPTRRPDEYERNQRYSKEQSRPPPSQSQGHGSRASTPTERSLLSGPAAAPSVPPSRLSSVLKRSQSDRHSERSSSTTSRGDWEQDESHHTLSRAGAREGEEGQWAGSDFDTSELSASELKKLRKKGINPALYLEMKNARKGRGKWINPLASNTYIG